MSCVNDENVYYNDPPAYLPQLNDDHYLPLLRQKQHIHIVCGQGAYENPASSRELAGILAAKGIPHKLDLWGFDMPHDWPTWRRMLPHYLASDYSACRWLAVETAPTTAKSAFADWIPAAEGRLRRCCPRLSVAGQRMAE